MKTKIIIPLLFLAILSLKSFAQTTPVEILNNRIVGKNYIFQNDIMANEFVFEKRIHHSYVDSITGYATLELRKLSKNGKVLNLNGLIVVFDLKSKTVKWTKKIDYSTSSLNQYNNIIILTKGNKTSRLNIEDGSSMWEIKNDLYYVNPDKKIGIGYKYNGLAGHLHTLEGINLENGETIWQRELNREYGWNKIMKLNDSDLLIVAGGLHFMNINTGQGWDYETVTGKKDYTETIAKNVGGIALGVLTGTYVFSSGSNLVRDVVSNTIIDSATIYFASREKLVSLNKSDGTMNWSYPLPEDSTSKSALIEQDSTLILVNKGYAYWGNKLIDFGEPFLLKIKKTTGEKIYSEYLNKKKIPIYDLKFETDSIKLLFTDELANYTLKDGLKGQSKMFHKDTYGTLSFFVGSQLYSKTTDPNPKYATISDSINYYVQTSLGKTLKLDKNFNFISEFNFDDLYLRQSILKNYTFINKGDQTIVLDPHNNPVGELNISFEFYKVGNYLYDIKDNHFIEIDLSQIIDSKTTDI